MEEKSLWQVLRMLLMNIAGNWYDTEKGETRVFSFCEKAGQEGQLIITDKNENSVTTVYSVNTYMQENLEPVFYIDTGTDWDAKRWYKIKEISSDNLLLIEINKTVERKETGNEISYMKKADNNFSDQMKKLKH